MGNLFTVPFGDIEIKEPDKVISFAFSKLLSNAALGITDALLSPLPIVGKMVTTALKLMIDSASFETTENGEALLKEFEKIIHKELATNEVNVATGKLAHVQRWLKHDYEPAVQSGHDSSQLYTMLKEKVSFLQEDVLSIVYEVKEFEEIGLKTFITAAAVHLAMLQEMAVRDPDTDSPEASRHAKSIAKYAPEYSEHAVRVAKKLVAKRQDRIKYKTERVMARDLYISFKWEDEVTGQVKGRGCLVPTWYHSPEDEEGNEAMVQRWCEERKKKVGEQLLSDLGQPLVVARKWRELETNPIRLAGAE